MKILLIGDPGVGKTSFVQRYTNDIYKPDLKGTVGVDFSLKVKEAFFLTKLPDFKTEYFCLLNGVVFKEPFFLGAQSE